MDISFFLKELGLSQKEVQIFLTTMELGMESAYAIAKKAKIKRTTTYAVLDQLIEKKFIFEIKKKTKKVYTTLQPYQLVKLWQEKEAQVKKEIEMIKGVLPQLESLYNNAPHKPIIKYYEGRDGVRELHDELIKPLDGNVFLYYFTAVEFVEQVIGREWFMDFIKRRVKNNVFAYGIRNRSKEVKKEVVNDVYNEQKRFMREYRFAPVGVQIPMALYIRGTMVGIVSSKEESYGLMIESREYATLMKSLFDAMWQISEKSTIE